MYLHVTVCGVMHVCVCLWSVIYICDVRVYVSIWVYMGFACLGLCVYVCTVHVYVCGLYIFEFDVCICVNCACLCVGIVCV